MMTGIFLSFLTISVSMSVLIVVLLLLAPFFNKRYAAKWKYWIWVLLALRLIVPFGAGGELADGKQHSSVNTQTAPKPENKPSGAAADGAVRRRVVVEIPAQMAAPIASQSENGGGISVLDLIAFVWMSGSLLLISVHLVSYAYYQCRVRRLGSVADDGSVWFLLQELKRELHISCKVSVIRYSEAASPMLIGFLHPVIVLPGEQYDPKELYFILKHELVHFRRGDLYVKLLLAAAHAFHWFNPLVRMMQKEAAVDMELSCDECVVQGADYAERKAYTETLLSALHKQNARRTELSTQFYGGKQIMKKRFRNILIKTRKKNGAVILISVILTAAALGTLVGCSVKKEDTAGGSGQAESSSQPEAADRKQPEGSGGKDPQPGGNGGKDPQPEGNGGKEPQQAEQGGSDGKEAADNTKILTIRKEGAVEEKQATLVTEADNLNHEFSFYLPDGEWQKDGAAMWRAAANENVCLWVAMFEKEYPIEQILADDGYEQENGELVKEEEGILFRARLHEDGGNLWCVFYSYPAEAEEGWGRELPVIADTFAVIAQGEIMDGYISAFENGTATIDRQLWLTPESEDWKPEYNGDAGFEVVDAEGEDITYPLHEDCTFFILENHYDPTIELSRDEFAKYLKEMEYPVLWILELEDGQITSITEQYLP